MTNPNYYNLSLPGGIRLSYPIGFTPLSMWLQAAWLLLLLELPFSIRALLCSELLNGANIRNMKLFLVSKKGNIQNYKALCTPEGYLRTLPYIHGLDGFFTARLSLDD